MWTYPVREPTTPLSPTQETEKDDAWLSFSCGKCGSHKKYGYKIATKHPLIFFSCFLHFYYDKKICYFLINLIPLFQALEENQSGWPLGLTLGVELTIRSCSADGFCD
jgi:hypothetical protein